MSNPIPDTRHSLILRLSDKRDLDAWDQFVSIYQPLVYRLARGKGLQNADAQELVQDVMLAVSRAVDRWEPDAERGRFRDWLFTIARNLVINYLTRPKHRPLGTGGTDVMQLLQAHADPASQSSSQFDTEYRRELFHWAAQRVREQVKPQTWEAFRRTSIDGRSIPDVAAELSITVGAVHIARSRVLGRLRDTIETFGGDE